MTNIRCPACDEHQVTDWSLPGRLVRVSCGFCGFDTEDIFLEPGDDAEVVLRAAITGTRRAYTSLETLRKVVGLK